MERRVISEYSAGAFAFAIEQSVLDGFRLSDESQFYPCVNGFVYEAVMLKGDKEAERSEETPIVDFSQIIDQPKPARKGRQYAN